MSKGKVNLKKIASIIGTVANVVKAVKRGEQNEFVLTVPEHLNALYGAVTTLSEKVETLEKHVVLKPPMVDGSESN